MACCASPGDESRLHSSFEAHAHTQAHAKAEGHRPAIRHVQGRQEGGLWPVRPRPRRGVRLVPGPRQGRDGFVEYLIRARETRFALIGGGVIILTLLGVSPLRSLS